MDDLITIIEAGGDATSRGTAIGKAVAESVHDAVLSQTEFTKTMDTFLGTPYLAALRDATERAFPEYIEELTAMANAAEIEPEKLFVWNCRGDLRFPPDTAEARLNSLTEGCTTIMAPGGTSTSAPAIIAHNEDGDGAFMSHRYWVKVSPNSGPSFESFLYPGMLPGHSFGVNAAGLVQTINNIRPDDLKPGIPRHFICRAILAAESLHEAVSHLQRTDRASGFHHAIAFPGMAAPASIEAPASGMVLRNVDKAQAHANHLIDDYFSKIEQVVTKSSDYRQRTVDQYLNDGGDPLRPEDILFQQSSDGGQSVLRRPRDGGDDYGCTLATGVFRLFENRVEWSVHADPEHRAVIEGKFDT